jgi:hypothetical protein
VPDAPYSKFQLENLLNVKGRFPAAAVGRQFSRGSFMSALLTNRGTSRFCSGYFMDVCILKSLGTER